MYTYDDAQRLIKVEKNDTTLGEYAYDGDGKRIHVTENGETTTHIYSGIHVLYEETMTGTAVYIYGPTGRLAKKTTIKGESHTFYYHTDHLNSTRLVTDESKNVVTEAVYQPFGESTATGEESYLYNGKEKDETGLYYYGARYYDPDVGRFITRDPLPGKKGIPQSLNRYIYCLKNPVNLIDPAGLTYRMCNVDTRVCTRYAEGRSSHNPDRPVWVAHNATGEKITDSQEIERMLKNKQYLPAIVRILQILGYEVSDDNIKGDVIEFEINGVTVHIEAQFKDDPNWTKRGEAPPPAEWGKVINITIYFKKDMNMTFAELYHAVGHEMVHAYHYASGDYWEWEEYYGREGANAHSERLAYWWNLSHLKYVSYPGAWEYYFAGWLKYVRWFHSIDR